MSYGRITFGIGLIRFVFEWVLALKFANYVATKQALFGH